MGRRGHGEGALFDEEDDRDRWVRILSLPPDGVTQARKRTTDDNGSETLALGAPKTRTSRRTLVLPQPVLNALGQHQRRQRDERRQTGELWQELDLVPTNVGTPMSPSNLRCDLARLTIAASLGRRFPHELRHSAASLPSAPRVPLEQVAGVLGHTDTRMLLKHYRHPNTRSIDAAAAPMERLFGGQGGAP